MLRKEGLQAALEEARAPAKRAKHTGGTPQARKEHQEHLEHDLQASLHSVRPDGQARPLPGTICAELNAARTHAAMPSCMDAACAM